MVDATPEGLESARRRNSKLLVVSPKCPLFRDVILSGRWSIAGSIHDVPNSCLERHFRSSPAGAASAGQLADPEQIVAGEREVSASAFLRRPRREHRFLDFPGTFASRLAVPEFTLKLEQGAYLNRIWATPPL